MISLKNQVEEVPVSNQDVLRSPQEIMCEITRINPDFENMMIIRESGNYIMTDIAENGERYILRDIPARALAHDQRMYMKSAERNGIILSSNEISWRLKVADLFDELEIAIEDYRPVSETRPNCLLLSS